MSSTRRALLLSSPFLATPSILRAQTASWPSRPVRLVVPWPPGGSTDAVGRAIGQALGAGIPQPVVVDNRGGAGGQVGAEAVARSAPDGYTLLVASSSTAVMGPHLYRLPFDALQDFDHVVRVSTTANAIIVRSDLPAANLAELIAMAKARPGALSYGTPGNGTSGHLAAEYFNASAGVSMQHVPYRGTGPLLTDVLGGRLDVVQDNLMPYAQAVAAGRVRVLAVTSPERWYSAPEIPTVAEAANLPGFSVMVWWGVQAAKGTPEPILAQIAETVSAGFRTPEIQERMRGLGMEAAPLGRADFPAFVREDYERWGQVVRNAGIKMD